MVDEFPIGYVLQGVTIVEYEEFGDKELHLDEIQLIFEKSNTAITLRPLADTDEVELTQEAISDTNLIITPEWCKDMVGQKLQTIWVCNNSQGYQDQVIFAFGYLHPSLSFVSEGSVLKVFRLRQVRKG